MTGLFQLTSFLSNLSKSLNEIELSFPQIARIIDDSLPPSAYQFTEWWSNNPAHPQSAAWLDAGWRVSSVDLKLKNVNFVRILNNCRKLRE